MSGIGRAVSNAIQAAGRTQWAGSYEICPIWLVGGVSQTPAGQGSGGLPIVSLLNAQNFVGGLLSGATQSLGQLVGGGTVGGLVTATANNLISPLEAEFGLNDVFAKFVPVPGSKLVSQQIGKYPFANQQVAANAVIRQPLQISIKMICPAQNPGDYWNKSAILTNLKRSLEQHNNSGGTYTVVTPGYTYTNCVMLDLTDISDGESKQVQFQYQFDFEQPLLTLQDANQAYNQLMSKISSGAAVAGDPPTWSGLASSLGSGAVNTVIKAGAGLVGSAIAGAPLTPAAIRVASSLIGSL